MRIATCLAVASVMLVGTIARAQSGGNDFSRVPDFSRYKTYAWVRGINLDDETNHTRIVQAIEAQLASKGLRRVESTDRADVLVAYHARFDRGVQFRAFSSGWDSYRPGAVSYPASAEEFRLGTIAVDIVDARTETLVWRGMASGEVDVTANSGQQEKGIKRAAAKVFKNYPS